MSELVRKIAGDFLAFPTVIEVTEQATPAKTVTQALYKVPNLKTKLNLLQHLLKDDESFHRIIIFCKTKTVADNVFRSEEHTSELQSRENLVCRLLLEKKKKNVKDVGH